MDHLITRKRKGGSRRDGSDDSGESDGGGRGGETERRSKRREKTKRGGVKEKRGQCSVGDDELSDDDSQDTLEIDLEKVLKKIERLGPLNLAAIEEFSELELRKKHFDSQNEDLEKALEIILLVKNGLRV